MNDTIFILFKIRKFLSVAVYSLAVVLGVLAFIESIQPDLARTATRVVAVVEIIIALSSAVYTRQMEKYIEEQNQDMIAKIGSNTTEDGDFTFFFDDNDEDDSHGQNK